MITYRQLKMILVLSVFGVFFCGLFFVVTAERARASAQVFSALEREMARYSCSTQDNGTAVYTKTEDAAELVAQVSAVLDSIRFDMEAPVYNEISIDDWLTITGLDATNARAICMAGQGEIYAPSNTIIVSRERPFVAQDGDKWTITFGD